MTNQQNELQITEMYNRHSGMVDLNKIMETEVEIVGMGSIGSHALYALACQGFQKFKCWDNDIVEISNIANQVPGHLYLGESKLDANIALMRHLVHENVQIEKMERYFTEEDMATGKILVPALDTLQARRTVFEFTKCNGVTELVLDFRIGGRVVKGYVFDPNDLDDCDVYEMSLVDQSLQAEMACTEKMCIQSVLFAAAEMAEAVAKWSNGKMQSYKVVKDFRLNYLQRVPFEKLIS